MTDETDRCLLMREWQGCPDAALATADVCGRFSRTTNRSALAALQALLDYGAPEREVDASVARSLTMFCQFLPMLFVSLSVLLS